MPDEKLPDGYAPSSPATQSSVAAIVKAAMAAADDSVVAVAVVIATKEGLVSSGFGGDLSNTEVMAKLLAAGPSNLRITIERMMQGKGRWSLAVAVERKK